MRADSPATAVRRLQPSSGFIAIDFQELWRYRELLYRMLWRDLKARYKQTFLGPAWVILRPLVSMILMAAVFGGLAGFKSGTATPYPLFRVRGDAHLDVFLLGAFWCGIVHHQQCGDHTKVYFPRLLCAALRGRLATRRPRARDDRSHSASSPGSERWPNWHIVFAPLFVLLALVAGLGHRAVDCGRAVRYRDIAFTLPYVTQIALYATPGALPSRRGSRSRTAPDRAEPDDVRARRIPLGAHRYAGSGYWRVRGTSAGVGIVILVAALYYFRRMERTIIDHV